MPRQEYTDRDVLITNNAMSGLMGCATRQENVANLMQIESKQMGHKY